MNEITNRVSPAGGFDPHLLIQKEDTVPLTNDMKEAVYEAREAERRYVIALLTERHESFLKDGGGDLFTAGIADCIDFLTGEDK